MKKNVFLDTSAINTLNENLDLVLDISRSKKIKIIIGVHVLYELMRTFNDLKCTDKGVQLFNTVQKLTDFTTIQTDDLIKLELNKFSEQKNLVLCQTKLGGKAKKSLEKAFGYIRKKEIEKIDEMLNFINKRDSNSLEFNLCISSDAALPAGCVNFDQYLHYVLHNQLKPLERQIPFKIPAQLTLPLLVKNLESLPAFSSWLYGALYIDFLSKQNQRIGKDKIDDIRNVIDAAYSDYFITNDAWLAKSIKHINKKITVMQISSIKTIT